MQDENPIEYTTPNSLAAVWSMMLPGLGQMMKGQVLPGIIWAGFVASGYYAFFWPGLIIHGLCILDAGLSKGNESWVDMKTWPRRLLFLALLTFLLGYIYYRNI